MRAARNPKDCLDNLIDFCSSLRSSISTRFHRAVPNVTIQLYNMFDLEKALTHLCNFMVQNGKLIPTREHKIEWETYGVNEFNKFFQVVCNIPHVSILADSDSSLMLLPHNSVIVFKRFKDTLEKIIWFGLGNHFDLFVDMKGNFLPQFQDSHLVSMSAVDSAMLDQKFNLKFASGVDIGIAEQDYHWALSISADSDFELHLKRSIDSCFINNYFIAGLKGFAANVDLQPVFNHYKCITYVCSTKDETNY